MPTTTPWLVAYPDSNSNLTPLESHFQNLATTTNTAITAVQTAITSAQIDPINNRLQLNLTTSNAAPTGAPAEGSMHWDSNSNILYIYSTGVWRKVWNEPAWNNITVNSGFAGITSAPPMCRIIGDVVYLRGGFTSAGISANTSHNVGQLPVGFRPSYLVVFAGMTSNGSGNEEVRFELRTDGQIFLNSSAVQSTYLNGSYAI
jgi:hypothetical protein